MRWHLLDVYADLDQLTRTIRLIEELRKIRTGSYLLGRIILGMKLSDSSLDMLKVSLRLSKLFETFSLLKFVFWWWNVLVIVCLWSMLKAGLR